jgi:hypothetical protein
MFYEKDWFMRQVKVLVRSVAQLVFHRDIVEYTVEDESRLTETDCLHRDLMDLLSKGMICEAEDSLFDRFQPGNSDHLLLALDFYQRLNSFTDGELEARNFSRDEIYDGLRDLMSLAGLDFYGL